MSLLSLVNAGNIAFLTALLVIFSFKNVFLKAVVVLFVAVFVKFRSGFDPANIAFLIALVIGAILEEKLPFAKGMNVALSILISFIAFNAYLWLSLKRKEKI